MERYEPQLILPDRSVLDLEWQRLKPAHEVAASAPIAPAGKYGGVLPGSYVHENPPHPLVVVPPDRADAVLRNLAEKNRLQGEGGAAFDRSAYRIEDGSKFGVEGLIVRVLDAEWDLSALLGASGSTQFDEPGDTLSEFERFEVLAAPFEAKIRRGLEEASPPPAEHAAQILQAHGFPLEVETAPSELDPDPRSLTSRYAWAWIEGEIFWASVPAQGLVGGQFLFDHIEGLEAHGMLWWPELLRGERSVRGSWWAVSRFKSEFHRYLPPESPFHWALQTLQLMSFFEQISNDEAMVRAWRTMAPMLFDAGRFMAEHNARSRHTDSLRKWDGALPGRRKQGQAGGKNARDRAWNRWGKVIQPFVKNFISSSEEPNLGVGSIHDAVMKAIGRGDLPVVKVPTDQKTFKEALKRWEKNGLIPTWSGLASWRKRESR